MGDFFFYIHNIDTYTSNWESKMAIYLRGPAGLIDLNSVAQKRRNYIGLGREILLKGDLTKKK